MKSSRLQHLWVLRWMCGGWIERICCLHLCLSVHVFVCKQLNSNLAFRCVSESQMVLLYSCAKETARFPVSAYQSEPSPRSGEETVSVFVCLSWCPSTHLSCCLCLSVCHNVHPLICPVVCVFVCLLWHPSTHLSSCLCVCLSVMMPIHSSVQLLMCLSVCHNVHPLIFPVVCLSQTLTFSVV